MIGAATKLIIVVAMIAVGWCFVPYIERFAHDPHLVWIAMLPVAYVVGMLVLMHD